MHVDPGLFDDSRHTPTEVINSICMFLFVGFVIVPTDHTVARDREALFHCQNSVTERVHWEINGTAVDIVHPEDVILHIDGSNFGGTLHTLSIRGNLHYNLTSVKCVASFTNAVFRTEPAMLSVVDGR